MLQISLGNGQELGTNLPAQGGLLRPGQLKNAADNVGGLMKHLFFHSLDKTFPPELNLHHSESTVKVLKSGSEGQVNTDPHQICGCSAPLSPKN